MVAKFKNNVQKSIAFLYTWNERPKNEIKITIPFTVASKRIKYLGINLTEEMPNVNSRDDKHC